ncbi:MAG: type I restriction enzyme R subunit [Oleiphilaceae bacterium]|jgi:type I restriction enzyme R subunit
MLFTNFEEQVKERNVVGIPDEFGDNKHAKAYYGLFKFHFDAEFLAEKDISDEKMIAIAFKVDNVVNTAVQEFSINPSEIETSIRRNLMVELFHMLGIDGTNKLLEAIIKKVRLGLS